MENFKISVDVNVKFSEETIKFFASIFTGMKVPAGGAVNSSEHKPAPAKPADATPAPAAPAAPVAPAAPAVTATKQPSSNTDIAISIDQVRAALAKKVNAHREEIKNKLNELGAPSVTKLDSSKYEDMLNFLNSLD